MTEFALESTVTAEPSWLFTKEHPANFWGLPFNPACSELSISKDIPPILHMIGLLVTWKSTLCENRGMLSSLAVKGAF